MLVSVRIDRVDRVALLREGAQSLIAELAAIARRADHSHRFRHSRIVPSSVAAPERRMRSWPTLAEVLEARTAEAAPELVESHRPQPAPLLCVRPRMPDSRGRRRRLQGARQSRRRAARAVGLRRRHPVRSDREEALLPRASRRARLQLRDARLRPPLLVLPELGDVAGAPRSAGRVAPPRMSRPTRSPTTRVRLGARVVVSAPITSR